MQQQFKSHFPVMKVLLLLVPDVGLKELNPGMPFTTGQFTFNPRVSSSARVRSIIIIFSAFFLVAFINRQSFI